MNTSNTCKIVIIFLLIVLNLVFFSCGEDNPLITASEPDILPLAKGAIWEYHYETSLGLSGSYTLTVQDKYTFPDSIIYLVNTLDVPAEGDSTVSVSWQVLNKSDTLWVKREQGEWKFMAPLKAPAPDSGWFDADFVLFFPSLGGEISLFGSTLFKARNNGEWINLERWGGYGNGEIIDKGVSRIALIWKNTSHSHPISQTIEMLLENYTPGAP